MKTATENLNTKIDNKNFIKDSYGGEDTYFEYSSPAMSTTNWLAAWDGHILKAISPSQLFTYKDVKVDLTGLTNGNSVVPTYYKAIANKTFYNIDINKIIKIDLIGYNGQWRLYNFVTYGDTLYYFSNYNGEEASATARIWYWNL